MQEEIHKQSWFKAVFQHGKWYILSSIFTKGVAVFLLPVYTNYLSPEDYGVLSSLNSIGRLLPIFISLYLDAAFGRFFHDFKNDKRKLSSLFSTIYWFVLVNGILMVGLVIASSKFWLRDLIQRDDWSFAFLAFIPPLFLQVGTLGVVFLRQSLLARQTTIVEIITTIISVLSTLYLLIVKKYGVLANLSGSLLGALFIFTFYSIYFIRNDLLRLYFSKSVLKMCLIYSIPLIPNIAGGWIAGLSDRLIIAKYDSLTSAGLYSIGFNIAFILYIISDSITQVIEPVSMSGMVHDKENTLKKIANTSFAILSIMLMAHLGITLFSKEILAILTQKSYHSAFIITAIISFPYVISSQYRLFSTVISYHKKTWILSSAGIISAFANLGLNVFLVPIYGYISAAIATIVSTLAYAIWIFVWSQKLSKVKLDINKILKTLLIYLIALIFGLYFLLKDISFINFSVKLAVYSVALFLVVKFSIGLPLIRSLFKKE